MSDYSDIFLAMGLSTAILEKAEKQSKRKNYPQFHRAICSLLKERVFLRKIKMF